MAKMKERNREVAVTAGGGRVVARLDIDRPERCGAPEAVFAQGKTTEETLAIVETLVEKQGHALVTRANRETIAALLERWPGMAVAPNAGAAVAGKPPKPRKNGPWVAVTAAGTSDIPVAEEALLTLEALGIESRLVADVGVAGIHRLMNKLDILREAAVIIAVAGMEGALPSVMAGLVAAPVIAVPTSVGYGAALGGLAALLGMLTSCSPGIAVVNIDNGFGAAMAASRIIGHSGRKGRGRHA